MKKQITVDVDYVASLEQKIKELIIKNHKLVKENKIIKEHLNAQKSDERS